MRRVESTIISAIKKHRHERDEWYEEITTRDSLTKTAHGVIIYRLHDTAIVTIVPSGVKHRNICDLHFDNIFLHCGKWKTATTLSRFNAFLQYFVGATMWEKYIELGMQNGVQIHKNGWTVSSPDFEDRAYEDHMFFQITRGYY